MKFLIFIVIVTLTSCAQKFDWRTASRESAKIAPLPSVETEAIVQVYGAKTVRWRGYFSIHSWVSIKEKNASHYTNFHVVGWRSQEGQKTIRTDIEAPDRYWFGEKPSIIAEYRGEKAEEMIPLIKKAVESYPYPSLYRAYPGPNSNTFVSHIIRSVPGMGVELPSNAIGKDWIHDGDLVGWSESKTGVQLSLYGLLGITVGLADGLEFNVLGLNLGVDVARPALKLPFIGRLGMKDGNVLD